MRKILILMLMLAWFTAPASAQPAREADELPEPIEIDLGNGEMINFGGRAEAIYIANPEIADVQLRSPTLMYYFGKAPGETTVTVVGRNEKVILQRRIVVQMNTQRLTEMIELLHPDSSVNVRGIGSTLILTGTVASASDATDIVEIAERMLGDEALVMNRLHSATPNQVNLRVRIAEVSRDTTKRLGFSWDIVRAGGELSFGLATGAVVSGVTPGSSTFSIGRDGSRFDVNGLIDALDDAGLITVLAEPNLTALSGELANFLAGGSFPIPVPGDDGTVTIQFQEYGVGLSFLPVVLDDGRLHIKVNTEVSQLSSAGSVDFAGFNIPALTIREASTTVNLGSGQSFAIAGLLQDTVNQDIDGTAGLADLPVLGALFRSSQFQREESELVVIVTPYLVRPSDDPLGTPVDGFHAASDGAQIAHGHTHTRDIPSNRTEPTAGKLSGPGGFILQ